MRADVVIVQNVDGMAQSTQMTIMVGPDKVRTDVTPQISTITDTATGDVTTLMHAQKSYLLIPIATSRAMMARAMQQAGSPSASPAPPVATGKTDKINGYDAAEYTFSNGNLKATYWICKDFPDAQMVKDALAKLAKGGMAAMLKGMTPDMSTFPGVPVKTEVETNGQKITTELVSAKEQTVDPSEYQVPAGYTEMKMPTMPGQ
jgi:citrate lyase beta subunit